MASSRKHWPSMFKSKPRCNNNQNNPQWQYHQHDTNNPSLMSSCYPRTASHTSVLGSAERSPEPKPRWNPRPEQIRILESIFNSGTINPPRDEIRKIRARLQEYGQVGDANVFYWFQNRKSRSKHKLRHLHNSKQQQPHHHHSTTITSSAAITAPTPSSSLDKYSPTSTDMTFPFGTSANIIDMSNSPTSSVNQPYFQTPNEFLPEPFFFPVQQPSGEATASAFSSQGFCFPELANGVHVLADQTAEDYSNLLLMSERMMNPSLHKKAEVENQNLQHLVGYTLPTAPTASIHSVPPPIATVPSSISQILGAGIGDSGAAFGLEKATVFINDVAIEVASGPFNVREAFGDDAVLVNSSGLPVLTNQWGITLHPLQHGEFYYLIRTSIPITP